MERITVFILNYNEIDAIRNGSLDSIKKAVSHLQGYDVSVVYLDNFSGDGSPKLAKAIFPDGTIASTFRNEGYVRGTNIGLQLAWRLYRPHFFLLVDSDNYCDENAYAELLDYAAKHPNAAMIQPMIKSYKKKDTVLSCGHTFNAQGGTNSITTPYGEHDIEHLESCSISSTLFRASVFQEIGLLNEAFEMYYESSDISFRIRERGYDCACCPDSVAYNERLSQHRMKDFRKYYLMRRNLFLFWFLHDTDRYNYYVDYWRERYEKYQSAYDVQPFIKDYVTEAERRGIYEGYRLNEYSRSDFTKIPFIDDFNKDDVILL